MDKPPPPYNPTSPNDPELAPLREQLALEQRQISAAFDAQLADNARRYEREREQLELERDRRLQAHALGVEHELKQFVQQRQQRASEAAEGSALWRTWSDWWVWLTPTSPP